MADQSKIEWTDATWTPIRARWFEPQNDGGSKERVGWHCEHVSEGCRNCYSESINRRLGTGIDFKPGNLFRQDRVGYANGEAKVFLDETMVLAPLRWKRPRMIFVCSMTDLFASFVPDAWIDRVFAVMALCPEHTFQVLTKRPARMRAYLTRNAGDGRQDVQNTIAWDAVPRVMNAVAPHWGQEGIDGKWRSRAIQAGTHWPLPNVWFGTSCEIQATADVRIPELIATPAAVRFVSAEPLLGPIVFTSIACPTGCRPPDYCNRCYPDGQSPTGTFDALAGGDLDWIIVGGESGAQARPMHPDWARSIRDQCAAADVAFHFKQWGEFVSVSEQAGDGRNYKFDDGATVRRIGKKLATRRLDGVEHNGMPVFGGSHG